MDEPTSALSLKETAKVLQYIRNARERNLGVVVITHNIGAIFEIADRFTCFPMASLLAPSERRRPISRHYPS